MKCCQRRFAVFRSLSSIFAFGLLACLAAPGLLAAATIHVAPSGSDANNGSAHKPFATLTRARDEIRNLKRDAHEPLTVVIHGGTYVLNRPLELSKEDSGSAEHPILWQAAAGEQVRIAGGPVLPAGDFKPVTDAAVLKRLPESARSHIVQLDLKPFHLIVPAYPDTFRGVPASPELFFNHQRMAIARWPNDGWATIAQFVETGSIPRNGDMSNRPGVFAYSGDEPARWNLAAGVWLQGYWCYDWYDQTIRIRSIDTAKRQITLAGPALYGVQAGNAAPRRFRAINLLEELDAPGEFYIDRAAQTLYFDPPGDIAHARIALSTLDAPLLHLSNVEHVTLRGLTIEAGLADGIDITDGRGVRIENCTLRNLRELGIHIAGGADDVIHHCDITDTGAGGLVLAGGDRKTLTAAHHQATDNHIWNFSRLQLTGPYAITLSGVGNIAAHNHIQYAPHQAVLIDGNDHVLEYNVLDHLVTASDDAGAVYKGRNPSCRGNIIRYNLFADIGNSMAHMTNAIYFDDGDGGDTVLGNVFVRCGSAGNQMGAVFSHGGHGLRAENNLFIDSPRALGSTPWDDARWKDALAGGQDCHWPEKLLKDVDITRPPYTTHYPELVGFMTPDPSKPRISYAKNNVLVRCPQASTGNWRAAPGATAYWSTDRDPGFVNGLGGNYALRPDSEVFKELPGFQPIPFEQIGTSDHR